MRKRKEKEEARQAEDFAKFRKDAELDLSTKCTTFPDLISHSPSSSDEYAETIH